MQWQNCFRCRSGRALIACRRRCVVCGGLALIEMDDLAAYGVRYCGALTLPYAFLAPLALSTKAPENHKAAGGFPPGLCGLKVTTPVKR